MHSYSHKPAAESAASAAHQGPEKKGLSKPAVPAFVSQLQGDAKAAQPKAALPAVNPFQLQRSQPAAIQNNVVQMVVSAKLQPTANVCWAAVGYAIHRHSGGASSSLRNFVRNYGTAKALRNFDNDRVLDIDEIIGSQSNANRLNGSDSAGSYGRNGITAKLNAGNPIVANVNNNHYIILTSIRRTVRHYTYRGRPMVESVYKLTYMDPATGSFVERNVVKDPGNANKIIGVGAYSLSTLYYTS